MHLHEKTKRSLIAFLLCGCMILFLVAYQGWQSKRKSSLDIQYLENGNVVITAYDFMGVIIVQATSQNHWNPEVDDILTLEGKIEDYLSKNDHEFHSELAPTRKALAEYYRQYEGIIKNGKRAVRGFFFCDSPWSDEEWQRGFVDVSGGGDCYFYVDYELEKGVFSNIRVNAPK